MTKVYQSKVNNSASFLKLIDDGLLHLSCFWAQQRREEFQCSLGEWHCNEFHAYTGDTIRILKQQASGKVSLVGHTLLPRLSLLWVAKSDTYVRLEGMYVAD